MKRRDLLIQSGIASASFALPAHAFANASARSDAILLGQSVALSGPLGQLGKEYTEGARLWFDQVNAQGGVGGRKIELLSVDDANEIARAVANTKQLVDEKKVFAMFGQFGTGVTRETLQFTTKLGIPVVAPYTGADALRDNSDPLLFHVRASYGQELKQIIEHLFTTGVRRIGVVYQDDGFGRAALASAEAVLARLESKAAVAASISVSPSVNVSKAVVAIGKGQPAAIVMCVSGEGAVAFLKEYRKTGVPALFYGLSEISSRELVSELGESARGVVISQVVPSPWSTVAPISMEYQRLRRQKWLSPGWASLEGFIAAKVVAEGLKRAGRNLTRERLAAELEGITKLDLGGFHVNYGPGNRTGSRFVELSMISTNGEFVR